MPNLVKEFIIMKMKKLWTVLTLLFLLALKIANSAKYLPCRASNQVVLSIVNIEGTFYISQT